jgi:hypothetical protein
MGQTPLPVHLVASAGSSSLPREVIVEFGASDPRARGRVPGSALVIGGMP